MCVQRFCSKLTTNYKNNFFLPQFITTNSNSIFASNKISAAFIQYLHLNLVTKMRKCNETDDDASDVSASNKSIPRLQAVAMTAATTTVMTSPKWLHLYIYDDVITVSEYGVEKVSGCWHCDVTNTNSHQPTTCTHEFVIAFN